jgi:hypothetical protein
MELTAVSAVEVLKAARAAGIHIAVDGDDLLLEASVAPPPEVLDALFRDKPRILALLRRGSSGCAAGEWWTLFEERAAVAEYDRGLPRKLAEAEAFQSCIVRWLNRNPVTSTPGLCIDCGTGDQPGTIVLPYGTTPPGAAWLHGACWPKWWRGRVDQATAALAAIGITNPAEMR